MLIQRYMFTSVQTKTETVTHCKPVKHTDDYKIVVILDESGSMQDIADEMISSLNGLIQEQKTIKDKICRFTLVKFNNNVTRVITNKKLKKIGKIDDYKPCGGTALYDAIGETIDWFRYERDVTMIVITDGQENSSTQYRKNKVMNMVKEKETYAGWNYVYLGCDLATASQGNTLGFKKCSKVSNCRVPKNKFHKFIAEDLNIALTNNRCCEMSIQSQLNCKY